MNKRVNYYSDGERIITAGKLESRMYIILEGEVSISLQEEADNIEVALLKKGDFFGEFSLFTNAPRSANATSVGPVKVAFVDDAEQLEGFLIDNPIFAAKMIKILTMRLAKTNDILTGKISQLKRFKLMRQV